MSFIWGIDLKDILLADPLRAKYHSARLLRAVYSTFWLRVRGTEEGHPEKGAVTCCTRGKQQAHHPLETAFGCHGGLKYLDLNEATCLNQSTRGRRSTWRHRGLLAFSGPKCSCSQPPASLSVSTQRRTPLPIMCYHCLRTFRPDFTQYSGPTMLLLFRLEPTTVDIPHSRC